MIGLALGTATWVIVVGIVAATNIIVGAASFYAGSQQKKHKKSHKKSLKDELKKHEKETRAPTKALAKQTEEELKKLKQTTEKQNKQLEEDLKTLGKAVGKIEKIAEPLESTSSDLARTAQESQKMIDALTLELNQLKEQFVALNLSLKLTQDALLEKDASLKSLLEQLESTRLALGESSSKSQCEIESLTKQLKETQVLLKSALTTTEPSRELEITQLRTDNARMVKTMQHLETTLKKYQTEFKGLSKINKDRLKEIRVLHDENIRLTETITLLSDALEEKSSPAKPSTPPSSTGMKLFA